MRRGLHSSSLPCAPTAPTALGNVCALHYGLLVRASTTRTCRESRAVAQQTWFKRVQPRLTFL